MEALHQRVVVNHACKEAQWKANVCEQMDRRGTAVGAEAPLLHVLQVVCVGSFHQRMMVNHAYRDTQRKADVYEQTDRRGTAVGAKYALLHLFFCWCAWVPFINMWWSTMPAGQSAARNLVSSHAVPQKHQKAVGAVRTTEAVGEVVMLLYLFLVVCVDFFHEGVMTSLKHTAKDARCTLHADYSCWQQQVRGVLLFAARH
jgi:hypothetical protein